MTTTAQQSQAHHTSCAVVPGCRADYDALAHMHYRGGPPATIARGHDGKPAILSARDDAGRLAGVAVASMPTLNAPWRALAWPGVYDTGNKRLDALEVNRSLRCISRVIVDPRFRGQGVARLLVRAMLDLGLTARTEAVAAMGSVCPFFAAAGMTAYPLPPSARDARFLDALASVGHEPWELLEHHAAERALQSNPWLARESRVWASGSPGTRRKLNAAPLGLLMLAASRAAQRPVAYAHGG